MEKTRYNHPSYGIMTVSRCSSSMAHPLYGSSIKHRETIRIQLHTSYLDRMLNADWPMKDSMVAEVELSQNQWAELVSSIGMGGGVPCTIRYNSGPVEECPFMSKREEFDQEFAKESHKLTEDIEKAIHEAEELLNKKAPTKADRVAIIELLQSAQRKLHSNIPFIAKQFTNQMDKTTTEAKAEVEAYQLARLNDLALAVIATGETKQLFDGNNTPALVELCEGENHGENEE